jgi:hypothetical protein
VEPDLAAFLYLADKVGVWVLNLGKAFRIRARTQLVPRSGNGQAKRIVGSFDVVDAAPPIEGGLALLDRGPGPTPEDFEFQGPVETLVLALRLRVVGA